MKNADPKAGVLKVRGKFSGEFPANGDGVTWNRNHIFRWSGYIAFFEIFRAGSDAEIVELRPWILHEVGPLDQLAFTQLRQDAAQGRGFRCFRRHERKRLAGARGS